MPAGFTGLAWAGDCGDSGTRWLGEGLRDRGKYAVTDLCQPCRHVPFATEYRCWRNPHPLSLSLSLLRRQPVGLVGLLRYWLNHIWHTRAFPCPETGYYLRVREATVAGNCLREGNDVLTYGGQKGYCPTFQARFLFT